MIKNLAFSAGLWRPTPVIPALWEVEVGGSQSETGLGGKLEILSEK
jgi:hypothetical protein